MKRTNYNTHSGNISSQELSAVDLDQQTVNGRHSRNTSVLRESEETALRAKETAIAVAELKLQEEE